MIARFARYVKKILFGTIIFSILLPQVIVKFIIYLSIYVNIIDNNSFLLAI